MNVPICQIWQDMIVEIDDCSGTCSIFDKRNKQPIWAYIDTSWTGCVWWLGWGQWASQSQRQSDV